MSHNEEIVNQAYDVLVEELLDKQVFIFENVEDNTDYLEKLVYLFVLRFGDQSTDENYIAVLMQIIEEVFDSLDVDPEELYNTVVQYNMARDQSEREITDGRLRPSYVDERKAGYIYVVTNPSMNMLVKIGYTTRNPKIRVMELSKHSGVPMPFILEYQEFFDDCIRAEEAIHTALDEKGYRVAGNREFFRLPVYEAIEIIQDFKGVIGD